MCIQHRFYASSIMYVWRLSDGHFLNQRFQKVLSMSFPFHLNPYHHGNYDDNDDGDNQSLAITNNTILMKTQSTQAMFHSILSKSLRWQLSLTIMMIMTKRVLGAWPGLRPWVPAGIISLSLRLSSLTIMIMMIMRKRVLGLWPALRPWVIVIMIMIIDQHDIIMMVIGQ